MRLLRERRHARAARLGDLRGDDDGIGARALDRDAELAGVGAAVPVPVDVRERLREPVAHEPRARLHLIELDRALGPVDDDTRAPVVADAELDDALLVAELDGEAPEHSPHPNPLLADGERELG